MTTDQLTGFLDAVSYTVVLLSSDAQVMYVNEAGRKLVGRSLDELCGREAERSMPEIFGKAFAGLRLEHGLSAPAHFEEYYAPLERWTELHLCPSPSGILVCARDTTSRKVGERIAAAQQQVLEMVACAAPLPEILRAITVLVEQQSKGDVCSILRLDEQGERLHGASCGSLPSEFCKAIEGAPIGPTAGSCGTAAFTRRRVVVGDIATDPKWEGYRELALQHGLRACWSQPIISRDGRRVLGTVANYSYHSTEPTDRSLRLLETAARLAQIAIEQEETEQKVRRHALAFEKLSDGIILADASGRVTDCNPAAEQMFGRGSSESHLTAERLDVARREGQWRGEVAFQRRDGARGMCETTVVPLRDADGRMTAAISVSRDVTERKRFESKLLAEASVTRVLATSHDLGEAIPRLLEAICNTCDWETGTLWTVDEQAEVLRRWGFWYGPSIDVAEFERTTREMTFSRDQGLPGRVWATARPHWIPDVSIDGNFPRKPMAVASGLRAALGFPIMLNGRVIAVLEFFTRAWREPDQTTNSMLMVIGNEIGHFMSRIQADEALRAAKESLDKANRAKDRFFAVLSHELRTPLSPALLLATVMAQDSNLPPHVRDDAEMIKRNIELQTRLIDDLLDVTRIENGKLTVRSEVVDLHELVRDCVHMAEQSAAAKGIRVGTELQSRRALVKGDPARLRQVVSNLLTNALKFTPANGMVMLRTLDGATDGWVRLDVTDTGIGMEPDMLARIFDPFEQAGRTAESKGLGLGLTICKGLVEAHGGRISASSRGAGMGLTITVELPALAATPTPVDRPNASECTAREEHDGAAAPLRILLVDDHDDTLRALSVMLRKLKHKVITANCVRSALAVATQNEFDLVISDLGLPDGTGTELMRELLRHRPIRGIALTGYGSESDVQQTRDAGFSTHLTKPIDFEALQAAIAHRTAG